MENKYLSDEELLKNKNLIYDCIQKYFSGSNYKNFEKEDLFQEGFVGLLKANKTYNPEKNIKFSSYAFIVIKNEIMLYTYKMNSLYSRHELSQLRNIFTLKEQGKTDDEIKKELNIKDKKYKMLINPRSYISLYDDAKNNNDNYSQKILIKDLIKDNFDLENDILNKVNLEQFISTLNDKEKIILEYLIKGKKQKEISEILGHSQSYISRLVKNIKDKFKNF